MLYPSAQELIAQQRTRRHLITAAVVLVVILVCGTLCATGFLFPEVHSISLVLIGLTLLLCIAIPIVVWNCPRIGLYIVFAGAVLFGGIPNEARATIPTTYVPFWWNISTIGQIFTGSGALNMLVISPAEVIMLLVAVCWLVRSVVSRQFRLERGAFFMGILAYTVMVGIGFLHGVATGGDVTMALYEVRAQAHFFLMYLMAANLITERRHAIVFLWVAVVCVGLQSLFGTITYIDLHGQVMDQGILNHDDSMFLNLLFFILLLCAVGRADRRLAWVSLALAPLAVITAFANQRRASIAAFAVALLPLLPMMWMFFQERRRQVTLFIAVFGLATAIYLPLAWHSTSMWALPARALRSQSDPSTRDLSSDTYRAAENSDLLYTRDRQPWTGIGYGKPFEQIVPLVHLTTDFLEYMPHNSVLWVWMRIGHIGFFCFLMMFATVFIKGIENLKETRDPLLKVVGLVGILYLLMMFVYGKYDLQFTNTRQMVTVAMLIGVLAILPKLEPTLDRPVGTEGPEAGMASLPARSESVVTL